MLKNHSIEGFRGEPQLGDDSKKVEEQQRQHLAYMKRKHRSELEEVGYQRWKRSQPDCVRLLLGKLQLEDDLMRDRKQLQRNEEFIRFQLFLHPELRGAYDSERLE